MGVSASGATLEIQLVADVARLQRDMKAMQDVVGSATAGAGKSFAGMSAQTVNSAAQMAAAAQASARASVGMATGLKNTGMAAANARIVSLEMFHVTKSLTEQLAMGVSPARAFASEIGRIGTAVQYSGGSVSGLIRQFAEWAGIITVTRNAELAEAAAQKAATAEAIRGRAERAASTLEARNVEVALAQAQLRAAETAEAETAAQSRLVKALRAVELAAGKAVIANDALSTANAEAAAAAQASNAKTVTSLGRLGVALGATAIVAGVAFAGFKSFQDQVKDSGELDKFAEGLRLTDAQIKAAGGSIKYLGDGTREITGLTVSFGDVASATFAVLAERAGVSADSTRSGWQVALAKIADFGKFTLALLLAGFAALVELTASTALNLGNLATGNLDKVTNPLKDMKDQFFKTFDDVNAGFDKIGQRAVDLAKKRLQAESDANKPPKPPKPKKQSDHGLAEALAELDAQIKGQNALTVAYQESDMAVIKAEALQKAEEQAIRHKGDVGIFYEKELALAIATRAAEGAKVISDLRFETDTRQALNDQVAAGTITATQANQQLQIEMKTRGQIAALNLVLSQIDETNLAIAHSTGAQKAKLIAQLGTEEAERLRLIGVIRGMTQGQEDLNAQLAREIALKEVASKDDEIAKLQLETQLIGASNHERAVRLAQLEAEQFIKNNNIAPGDQAGIVKSYVDAAAAAADLQTAQDNYNNSLSYTADLLGLINEQTQAMGQSLSDAFGNVGQGISTAITALTGYAATQAKIDQDHDAAKLAAGKDAKALADVEILYAKKSSVAKAQATMQALAGLKSLFKEHSAGYKVMTAIEKAYAVFQAVQTALAIARDIAHTVSSLANSATRTTANTAEGGSKLFAQLGVYAFPVVAAMVAIIAALGAKGGGGGGGVSIPNVDDLQAGQGAGTVLGDSKAKSESIQHSLDIVASNTNKDLEYTNEMLRTLRNIDVGISKLAGTIAQEIQVGNLFDTTGLKLGTSGSKGFLGIGDKSVTRTLADQGLVISGSPLHLASHYKNQALWNAAMSQVTGASVSSILTNGLYGASYTRTDEQRKSSTGVDYDTGSLSSLVTNLFVQVIGSMRDSIVAASKVVGLDGAQALVDAFQVKIGQISFEGMSGQEIEDQLNAIFSSIGDQMAGAVFPALKQMQKVGEGLLETFMRVAREYQVVDVELQSIGKTFGMDGVESLAGRDALVQLFGSIDEFVSQTDFFKEQFLTEVEQIAPIQQAVVDELARLGVSGVTTRDQFKALVLGLDLTTDAGRQMYSSLLALAPGFDKVLDYFDALNKKQIDTLQQQISQYNQLAASLQKYRDTLFQTDAAQGNAYALLKSRFISTANLAATGDTAALGGLQSAGQDFLTAAKNNASSLQDYYRDVALVARGVDKGIFAATETADYAQLQLDALNHATTILQSISDSTAAVAAALAEDVASASAAAAGTPIPTPSATQIAVSSPSATPAATLTPAGAAMVSDGALTGEVTSLKSEIEGLREDLNAALQAIAVNTGSADRLLRRWDRGDTMGVTVDGENPVDVNLAGWGGPGATS